MSKTKSSSPKKVTKRATKSTKHSSGPKISTPKTPKGVSDAMYKFMSEEFQHTAIHNTTTAAFSHRCRAKIRAAQQQRQRSSCDVAIDKNERNNNSDNDASNNKIIERPTTAITMMTMTTTTSSSSNSSNSNNNNSSSSSPAFIRRTRNNRIIMYSLGITEGTKVELANIVGSGSPRSDKCGKGFKVLVNDEEIAAKGNKGDTLVLTAKGIAQMPEETKPKDIRDVHDRFINRVENKITMGSKKVRPLWDILKDRKVHDIKAVSEMLGYKNLRSFENTKIIGTMKNMGLVVSTEGKGKIEMTDKPFPSI